MKREGMVMLTFWKKKKKKDNPEAFFLLTSFIFVFGVYVFFFQKSHSSESLGLCYLLSILCISDLKMRIKQVIISETNLLAANLLLTNLLVVCIVL